MRKSVVPLLLIVPMLLIAQRNYPVPQPSEPPSQTAQQQEKELSAEMRQQLKQGIKHVLISQVDAWNHGNLENFMEGYWRSPELTFFSGATVTKGWEPTLARYQQRYKSAGKEMGHLEFQDLDVNLLSRRSAVVTGTWKLTMSDGKTPHGLFTLIFMRFPEGWRIVHDHTSAE
ncbi:MAG TPA: nuclear transport factor 2 family protein [Candidatus Angelobacter sp.]|nr:nuclear transport factor 2 family protein [Candidatus Angelobacter sp.]